MSFEPAALIRDHIRYMPAYEPILPFEVLGKQMNLPLERIVKLDANENPHGPLPGVKEALAGLQNINNYPDPECRALREELAAYHHLPKEYLMVGAGADELIDLLMRLFLEPSDGLLICPPTFGMYAFDGDVNRAHLVSVPRLADFSIDLPAVVAAIQHERPKLVFLAHPNNPDGSLVDPQVIETLLNTPTVVVLDEAYIEFAPPGSSYLHQVPTRGNLVVLRTFSKWGGLAGLRVGYGCFPSSLMPYLWKIKQPYNVSVAASTAARISLQNASQLMSIAQELISERQRLYEKLENITWLRPYTSQANFILCRVVGRSADELNANLAQAGILVRYFNQTGLRDHIRISVGMPEHTDALLAALEKLE